LMIGIMPSAAAGSGRIAHPKPPRRLWGHLPSTARRSSAEYLPRTSTTPEQPPSKASRESFIPAIEDGRPPSGNGRIGLAAMGIPLARAAPATRTCGRTPRPPTVICTTMRRGRVRYSHVRTSLERIAAESLTPRLSNFVHGDISRMGIVTPQHDVWCATREPLILIRFATGPRITITAKSQLGPV
jgi:hypothetical protein